MYIYVYMEGARTNMFAKKCVLIYVQKLSFRLHFILFQIKDGTKVLPALDVCHSFPVPT